MKQNLCEFFYIHEQHTRQDTQPLREGREDARAKKLKSLHKELINDINIWWLYFYLFKHFYFIGKKAHIHNIVLIQFIHNTGEYLKMVKSFLN